MSENSGLILPAASRRNFLNNVGTATLSATAVALLVGCESMAQGEKKMDPAGDVNILNVALGLEYEAINAYQVGAESKLLSKGTLDVAVLFQTHHKQHAGAIVDTIRKLGGTPVASPTAAETARALNAAALKSEGDVVALAARLELNAARTYISVIPSFSSGDLAKVCGLLAADETMHWTALSSALKMPLPKDAFSFKS